MHFLLSTMSVVYVLNTPIPDDGDDATIEQIKRRNKWENDDYVCRGIILNDFKHTLKHKKEELTLVELDSHLRIEESLRDDDVAWWVDSVATVHVCKDRCWTVVRLSDPKLKTLGEKGIECIFVGYVEHSKAFKAINDEMDSIMDNNTWVLADLPPGCKPLGYKWIFNRKLKQAPKQRSQKFDEVVLSNGYLLNQADRYVYSKFDESGKGVIIFLYIDDMLIFDTDQVQVNLTKEFLSSRSDIAFAVDKLSRYTANLSTHHWKAIQRVLKSPRELAARARRMSIRSSKRDRVVPILVRCDRKLIFGGNSIRVKWVLDALYKGRKKSKTSETTSGSASGGLNLNEEADEAVEETQEF
ncbi:hypothetical protein Tco_0978137 [Tanacetum coccineum]|uniref:Reverse transcriptase Ty1/copia-type domain-containing protein n=1 Tax=Tanacetum coccineum TaxID=301880 RepID=A0ABQ5EM65_9ASTR